MEKPRRYLLDTAVSLKKGDFNYTPRILNISKKKTDGFDFDISRPLFSNFAQICY